MPWSKALSRGGDQNTFTGLQYSQSHGRCHYTGLILFPSVLGKTVISRFLFRFVFKTQYNALETKAPKTLQLNSYPVHWERIKKEPFFPLLLFLSLYLCSQKMHLLTVQRQALGQPVCTGAGGCKREKRWGKPCRRILMDQHQPAQHRECTRSRDRKGASSKEGKRKKGNQRARNG